MRGQGKFLAFWAPKGVLSFFHHKFLGISTNIILSVIISTIAQKRGSSELLPQSDTQLLPEHKSGLLQCIQSDRDILWVQQTIHGSPACPHPGRHLNLGQSPFPHLLLDLEGEHTLSSDRFRLGEHVLLMKKNVKISAGKNEARKRGI